jgi:hypothetical protein
MKSSISFFESVRLTYGNSISVVSSSPTASRIARSTSVLKITRPGVVRITSPCQRYSIGA